MRHGLGVRTSTMLILLFLTNVLLASCYAGVFKLPLRKMSRSVRKGVGDNVAMEGTVGHRSEREATLNLKDMVTNLDGESRTGYYVSLNIGTPPQQINVLIDTGSSNMAIACEPYKEGSVYFERHNSSTFKDDGQEVFVAYTEGSWKGALGNDVAALTSLPSFSARVNIACIIESENFFSSQSDWEGILGLGYSELSRPDPSIVTFWDSLRNSHPSVFEDVFSVQLCGSSFVHTNKKPVTDGSLILGGVLPELWTGPMLYAPIYKEWYYEVILTGMIVGDKTMDIDCKELNMDKTIVDTGTTSIRLPVRVFEKLHSLIVEHIKQYPGELVPHQEFFDGKDEMCYYNMKFPFQSFPVITFSIMRSENSVFRLKLSPQHYLRPVERPNDPDVGKMCVKYGFQRSETGTVLGAVFMEAFYVVFDRVNHRVGFAQTTCGLPDPTNRVVDKPIEGPFTDLKNFTECAFRKPEPATRNYVTVSYILLALAMVVFVPILLLAAFRLRKAVCQHSHLDDDEEQNVLSLSSGGH